MKIRVAIVSKREIIIFHFELGNVMGLDLNILIITAIYYTTIHYGGVYSCTDIG